jgi:hypothetical protein
MKIAIGLLAVAAAGLFITSCANDSDIPSAYGIGEPSAPNADASKGPESGEGDFAQHQ